MKIPGLICLVLLPLFEVLSQDLEGWERFSEVKFETRYSEEGDGQYYFPVFDQELRSQEGTEITLKGYFIPVDFEGEMMVISRYPYNSCFFCGGAGPESVVAVKPKREIREYYMDEVITVKGNLELNDTDIYMLNFIIEDAVVIDD